MHVTAIDDAAWDSPWRHRRCAEKVALSASLVLTALLLPAWPAAPLVAAASLTAILAWAQIPARVLAVVMAVPLAFILTGALTIAVAVGPVPSEAWWSWGVLSLTPASVAAGLDVLGHSIAGTLATMVLATTTPMVDVLGWLRGLRVPAPLLEIASLTYRLLFVLLATLLSVHEAQTNRLGFDPGAGGRSWRRPWRTTAATLGIVATRSWQKALRLSEGMELRGHEDSLMTVSRRQSSSPALLAAAVGVPLVAVAATVATGAW